MKDKIIKILNNYTDWFDAVQEDLIHEGSFGCIADEILKATNDRTAIKVAVDNVVRLQIDLDTDFDAIDLEVAIKNTNNVDGKGILTVIYNKWMDEIGHPEFKK